MCGPGADVRSPGADVGSPGAVVGSPGADVGRSRRRRTAMREIQRVPADGLPREPASESAGLSASAPAPRARGIGSGACVGGGGLRTAMRGSAAGASGWAGLSGASSYSCAVCGRSEAATGGNSAPSVRADGAAGGRALQGARCVKRGMRACARVSVCVRVCACVRALYRADERAGGWRCCVRAPATGARLCPTAGARVGMGRARARARGVRRRACRRDLPLAGPLTLGARRICRGTSRLHPLPAARARRMCMPGLACAATRAHVYAWARMRSYARACVCLGSHAQLRARMCARCVCARTPAAVWC